MTTLITLDEAPPLVQLEFAVYEAAGLLPKLTERLRDMAEAHHNGKAVLANLGSAGLLAANVALVMGETALEIIAEWAEDGVQYEATAQTACKHINSHAQRALAEIASARELVLELWTERA